MKRIIASLFMVLLLVVLIVTPILATAYIATITLANSGSTIYTHTPFYVSIDNEYLIDNAYVSSEDYLDVKIDDYSNYLPMMPDENGIWFVPSWVAANSNSYFRWSSGNEEATSFPIIVGDGGYVTTTDDDDIELGNNFALTMAGRVDTSSGADKNLVSKTDAYKMYISNTDELTAEVETVGVTFPISVHSGYHYRWDFPTSREIAVDSTGRIYVIYNKYYDDDGILCVAYSDNGGITWVEEEITDTATDVDNTYAMCVDSDDDVHVVYFDYNSDQELYYAKRTVSWSTPSVFSTYLTTGIGDVDYISLSSDSYDTLYCVMAGNYAGASNVVRNIIYMEKTASWGTPELVTDAGYGQAQKDPGIAIDSSGDAHVIWCGLGYGSNPTKYNVQYRSKDISWDTQVNLTDENSSVGGYSIAINSTDDLFVTYSRSGVIYYKTYDGSWSAEVSTTANGSYPSVAYDSDDDIYIAFNNSGNIYIKRCVSSVWQATETLVDNANVLEYACLAWSLDNPLTDSYYLTYEDYDAQGIMFYSSVEPESTITLTTNIETGNNIVSLYVNTGTLYLDVYNYSAVLQDQDSATLIASVADNANNIVWNDNDVMPYMDYITITVDSVEVLEYMPVTLISGTTLDDEDVADDSQNGTITWGISPADSTLSIESIVSGSVSGSGLIASGLLGDEVDLLQEGGTTDYTTMTVPDNPISPIIEAITSIMSLAGSPFTVPEQIVWILAFTILIMGMMFLSMKYMPNQLIGSIVCIGLSILAWKMAIYPFAMVIFVVVGCIAILVWERKPSL